jgi:CRISPR-associated protein Cmr5
MTRQQQWAHRAFEKVSAARMQDTVGKYKTMCMRFPSLLVQSGLVQALHFLSRDHANWGAYLTDLASVVGTDAQQLLRQSRTVETTEYMALGREVRGAALWMRRLAQSELAEVTPDEGDR